jgi:hypothetical protein
MQKPSQSDSKARFVGKQRHVGSLKRGNKSLKSKFQRLEAGPRAAGHLSSAASAAKNVQSRIIKGEVLSLHFPLFDRLLPAAIY